MMIECLRLLAETKFAAGLAAAGRENSVACSIASEK
jgi:hypothetical protein